MTAAYLAAADCWPILPMTINDDLGHDSEMSVLTPIVTVHTLESVLISVPTLALRRKKDSTHHTANEVMVPASFIGRSKALSLNSR